MIAQNSRILGEDYSNMTGQTPTGITGGVVDAMQSISANKAWEGNLGFPELDMTRREYNTLHNGNHAEAPVFWA